MPTIARLRNNSEVFLAFAQGISDAECGTAVSVRSGVLFSYQEPIAYIVGGSVDTGGAIHMTTARFSVTTSKHRSGAVSGAVMARIKAGQSTNPVHDYIEDEDHAVIRNVARSRGESVGSRGASHDG